MKKNLTAETTISVHASKAKVWDALTKPELVKQYMMGANLTTDWKVGSPITYTGEYQGKPFEEKWQVKKFEPEQMLQTTHFSTSSGKEDKPENYALVTYSLEEKDGETRLTVAQDHLEDDEGVEGSKKNWSMVLQGLKKTVEGRPS
ncbi:SRPBCC family protein [soil metagenome]